MVGGAGGPDGKRTQSGGQVWDKSVVIQGQGPCGRGGIPGAHRTMVDSELLPRRAAHAAGGERGGARSPGRRGGLGEGGEGEGDGDGVTGGAARE